MRVARGRIPEALEHLKAVWARFHPESPVKYDFLDDRIVALYRNEAKMMQMFGYFSIFAIIISCLGLFGLASFTAERRTKEIGVRKVMGASLGNITFLLSKDFTKWVILANILAWPIAYFAMSKWLDNFAYHIFPSWREFVLAAFLTFLIALLTVSYQSIRAATADPIDSLRYE
jgi:putative ABC transport system permease protein